MLVANTAPKPWISAEIFLKKKLHVGLCSTCKRKNSTMVSDQTIKADGLEDFVKPLGKTAKLLERKF